MRVKYKRRAQRSLRTILIIWFLLFSIVPLAFLTGFSIIRYETAIDFELGKRLQGNARELATILDDYRQTLQNLRERHLQDPAIIYNLSTNNIPELQNILRGWMKSEISTTVSLFSRNGRLLVTNYRDEAGNVKEFVPNAGGAIFVSDENFSKIQNTAEYSFVEMSGSQKMSLILFSKVANAGGKTVGFIEQLIDLDQEFLNSIKKRMRVELILIRKNGAAVVSTYPDIYEYKRDFFSQYIQPEAEPFFELNLRGNPHGFLTYPMKWGQTDFFIAIGASKSEAKAVLKGVNYAFFSVVSAVIILLIVIILIISNSILKPLDDLVQATQEIQFSDQLVEIPIKSDTEIGLLTESFNEMSRNIIKARAELKAKIYELEMANREIRDTQTRLVHTSKMSSLGLLVAGVAHELNNPISFIYSNMSHLHEYADKLIHLANIAEKDPSQIEALKKELDIEYIKTDLPKLISSCEDGARRVRDIVVGLRNFSRLEEAKLKEIDIHEALDNTLNLLSGEIKNRIEVQKNYGKIPPITCFASQMNQVFMNILSNAVQAIKGTGRIWISTSQFVSPEGKDMISISIQDSGEGMSPQTMERIFDPFFSTKGIGQGTGLGLSISYGIIQNHGGEIQVKSEPGTGTEFVVNIPVIATPKDIHKDFV
jgi:two-component system, NtrC family, sensor kinase